MNRGGQGRTFEEASAAPRIGIVGGGISGIAAAYYLVKRGYAVELNEASDVIGGRVGYERLDGRPIEFGGKNIGRNYPLFREFIADMGQFHYEFFGINTSTAHRGKLRTIDSERPVKSLINVARLTGARDFFKLAPLLNAVRQDERNGYLAGEYFLNLVRKHNDVTLDAYFGQECCRKFLRPITVRMNGAEPDEYYVGNLGSNLKMILDKYDQLEEGVHAVVEAFARRIQVATGRRVRRLLRSGDRVVGIEADENGRSLQVRYDAVVIATTADSAAEILEDAAPSAAACLRAIRYYPVAVTVAKYRRPVFDSAVRAVVFDADSALSNAGAYGTRDRDIVRYTFSGRRARQTIGPTTDPSEAIALAERCLNRYVRVDAAERENMIYRYFSKGLCAYAPKHGCLVAEVGSHIADLRGLALTGDYVRGASLEACFRSAKEAVGRLDVTEANHPQLQRRAV